MTAIDSSTAAVDRLRPEGWDEFIGQAAVKTRLLTHIRAALRDDRQLQHIFLSGPPGFGKTSLAKLIALGGAMDFESVTMPLDSTALTRLVRTFSGVLLVDEIHAGTKRQQEDLLPLLEFGYIQTKSGQKIESLGITVVGATTEPDKVIPPLRDRFPIRPYISNYEPQELGEIVYRMAEKIEIPLDKDVCMALGQAAGGTPRNGRALVLAARDLWLDAEELPTTEQILEFCRIEPDGLEMDHLAYLRILDRAGAMGLDQMASRLRLHPTTVRELERLLLDRDFIELTKAGREIRTAGSRRIRK